MLSQLETIELENQFYARNDEGQNNHVEIGGKLGEGHYSISYSAAVNGENRIIRFFKGIGDGKELSNIATERNNLGELERVGVNAKLLAAGKQLRHIEYVGPQKNGQLVSWESNPIIYDGKSLIAYQICSRIDDRSADQLREERNDPVFVQAFGKDVGRTLAILHDSAQEASFPFYRTLEELDNYDHAYWLAKGARTVTAASAEAFVSRKAHAELAALLAEQTLPLWDSSQDHWQPIHGDLGLGNIITSGSRVTGIVDWDKARIGFKDSDFRGITDIPGALDAAADAYEITMRELTGHDVKVDRALACKVALSIHLFNANDAKNLPTQGGGVLNREAAEQLIAANIVLRQLANYDSSYEAFRPAFEDQAGVALEAYPGAHLTLR